MRTNAQRFAKILLHSCAFRLSFAMPAPAPLVKPTQLKLVKSASDAVGEFSLADDTFLISRARAEGWLDTFTILVLAGTSVAVCASKLKQDERVLSAILACEEFATLLSEVDADSRRNLSAPLLIGSSFDSVRTLLAIRDSSSSTPTERLRAIKQLEEMRSALSTEDVLLSSSEPLEQSLELDSKIRALMSDPTLRSVLRVDQLIS
jgi:hypothetical protein